MSPRVMRFGYVLAIATAACGEVKSSPDAPRADAAIDADVDAPPIDAPAGPFLAVANYTMSRITYFTPSDSGNVAPQHVLGGPATGLNTPKLATGNGFLFAANNDSITVYPATANGDTAPGRRIAGAQTGFTAVSGIAVSGGEIFVVTTGTIPSIRVFSVMDNGDAAPARIISGSNTLLSAPLGIAVFGGEIFIANNANSTVTAYPVAGNGNIAPLRSFAGPDLSRPSGIDVTATEVFVGGTDTIQAYPRNASGTAVAPLRNIEGVATGLAFSYDIFVHDGEIYTHNRNTNTVLVYPQTGTGDIPPTRRILGPATMLDSPQSVVVIP